MHSCNCFMHLHAIMSTKMPLLSVAIGSDLHCGGRTAGNGVIDTLLILVRHLDKRRQHGFSCFLGQLINVCNGKAFRTDWRKNCLKISMQSFPVAEKSNWRVMGKASGMTDFSS